MKITFYRDGISSNGQLYRYKLISFSYSKTNRNDAISDAVDSFLKFVRVLRWEVAADGYEVY